MKNYIRQTIQIRHPDDRWGDALNGYVTDHPHLKNLRLVSVIFRPNIPGSGMGFPAIDAVWEWGE